MTAAVFNIPTSQASTKDNPDWEKMDLESLPPVLAKQVSAIHEADQAVRAMKAQFAEQFNAAYSEPVPAGMVRRFGFNYNGLSFANVVPTNKKGKSLVKFTAKKAAK